MPRSSGIGENTTGPRSANCLADPKPHNPSPLTHQRRVGVVGDQRASSSVGRGVRGRWGLSAPSGCAGPEDLGPFWKLRFLRWAGTGVAGRFGSPNDWRVAGCNGTGCRRRRVVVGGPVPSVVAMVNGKAPGVQKPHWLPWCRIMLLHRMRRLPSGGGKPLHGGDGFAMIWGRNRDAAASRTVAPPMVSHDHHGNARNRLVAAFLGAGQISGFA